MAPYTYYFLFSLIICLIIPLAVFNAKFTLSRGKSIVGEKFTPNAPGYKKIKWLASSKGLIVSLLAEVAFIGNLAYSIHLVLKQSDQGYVKGLLLFGAIVVVALFVGVLRSMATRR